jgi:outer membrane protein assembly factor BamB
MPLPALLALLALSPAAPQDWPQFLGPDRTGVVPGSGWEAVGAAEPLWTRNVGLGYSCPSIVGEHLVTMGFHPEENQDVVLCLDPETGEELWWHAYEATDAPRYHGGGTLTTPTIAGGVVYTVNRHGRAFALDLETGEPRWERDYRTELELERTFHGYCASPVVLADRILLVLGGEALAVQRDDGEVLWRTEDHGDGAYTNPTVFVRQGRTLAAVMLGQTLLVLDMADGSVVHRMEWPLQGNAVHVAQPLLIDDRLLISSAYEKGAAMLRLGDALEPEVLWTSRKLRNKVTGLYLYDGHVYGFDESVLKCFDLEGNERWRERGLGMGALSIAGGRLLVLSSSGELIVAEATPEEYRELSRRQVLEGGSYWTMPVLSRGRIYVRNSLGDLACLDHRHGAAKGDERIAGEAPPAASLFSAHDQAVGGDAIRRAPGLRLSGEWEILGRGLARTPATLVLGPPDRWRLGLDSGEFVQVFDGEIAWEQKNGGFRLLEDDERRDAPHVLALTDLLAPACPEGAVVSPQPVAFAGALCWRVDSRLPSDATPPGEPRTVHHYFEVETGRLAGREGDGLSRMVFRGARELGSARVPAQIVVYRTDSGQEESFHVSGGEWVAPEAQTFERPEGLRSLLRTPEQREADSRRLRERYARELGVYRPEGEQGPDEDLTIAVEDGDLVAQVGTDRSLLLPSPQDEGAFWMVEFRSVWRFAYAEDGAVTGATLSWDEETLTFTRLD